MLTFDYGIKFSPPQAAKNMGFLCKEGGSEPMLTKRLRGEGVRTRNPNDVICECSLLKVPIRQKPNHNRVDWHFGSQNSTQVLTSKPFWEFVIKKHKRKFLERFETDLERSC